MADLATRFNDTWRAAMAKDSYVHPEHIAWDVMELEPVQKDIGDTTRWGHIVLAVFMEKETGSYIEITYEETSGDSEIDAFGRGVIAVNVIPKEVVKTVYVRRDHD